MYVIVQNSESYEFPVEHNNLSLLSVERSQTLTFSLLSWLSSTEFELRTKKASSAP